MKTHNTYVPTYIHAKVHSPRVRAREAGTYVLTLRPEGDGPPPEIRMRRGLKMLLRSCGLRCVRITQSDESTDGKGKSQGEAKTRENASGEDSEASESREGQAPPPPP